MEPPDIWVAKDDGSDIVRAAAIVGVGIDYNGNIHARLGHGEGATVTLFWQAARRAAGGGLSPAADPDHCPAIRRVRSLPDPAGP
jgi:hypothetical protein